MGGVLAGAALATAAGGLTAGYVACAAFTVLTALPYVLIGRDSRLSPADRPALRRRTLLAGFWIDPRRHPDFGRAWLTGS
ncbi:hypothetical protein AB0B01_15350 [Streptomyces sp. NPDC044571]|uniref:hypothetical protein n=1 Tax=Streptomyces sp. NPDC044571 TaxID=3155371 RepID=UPI0033CCAC7C